MKNYHWNEDTFGSLCPLNYEDLCTAANSLIDEFMEEHEDNEDAISNYSEELFEVFCADNEIEGVHAIYDDSRFTVTEINGYDEFVTNYSNLNEAYCDACYKSRINPKTCVLKSWDDKINLAVTNGKPIPDRYDYPNLMTLHREFPNDSDIADAIGSWFEQFNPRAWTGDCYPLECGECIRPVYDDDEITGWEIV